MFKTCGLGVAIALAFQGVAVGQASITGAVLPTARSVAFGQPATFFVTMVNSGDQPATGCTPSIRPGDPVLFETSQQVFLLDDQFQIVPGGGSTATIAAGTSQNFLLELTATGDVAGTIPLMFGCAGTGANYYPQINEITFTAVQNETPLDILAVSLTPSSDGVIRVLPGNRRGAMAIAATYVLPEGATPGPPASLVARPTAGDFDSQVALEICEVNANGQCVTPRASELATEIPQGGVRLYTVFATAPASGGLPLIPDLLRVQLDFIDNVVPPQAARTRASTSAAITAGPTNITLSDPSGIYHMRLTSAQADPTGYTRQQLPSGWVYVDANGRAVGVVRDASGFAPIDRIFLPESPMAHATGDARAGYAGEYGIFSLSSSTRDADIRIRFDPASRVYGTFLIPQDSGAPAVSGPAFARESSINFAGVAMTNAFADGQAATQISGDFDLLDSATGTVVGSLTAANSVASGSVSYADYGLSCSFTASLVPSPTNSFVSLDNVSIAGCPIATGKAYDGLAVRRRIDLLNGTGIHLLLYPSGYGEDWTPDTTLGLSLVLRPR